MKKRLKLAFPILFDEENRAANDWSLQFEFTPTLADLYRAWGLDLPAHNGTKKWTLPMPARFVVDREGILQQSEVHPDYTKRPEPATTLEVVRGL